MRKFFLKIITSCLVLMCIFNFASYGYEKKDVVIFDNSKRIEKPEKIGTVTNSPKIVIREEQRWKDKYISNKLYDKFRIIQANEKGYILYDLVRGYGDNKTTSGVWEYAEGYELLRLAGAYYLQEAYVYSDIKECYTGDSKLDVAINPGNYSVVEQSLLNLEETVRNEYISSSKGESKGVGAYIMQANNEYTYKFKTTDNNIANLVYVPTVASSEKVQILVNGRVVMQFSPRVKDKESSFAQIIEFEVPTYNDKGNPTDYEVTIKNVGNSGVLYASCFNFKRLKEYNNEYITDYKTFDTYKDDWISSPGASDYAYYEIDEDVVMNLKPGDNLGQAGEFRGSYHGEEYIEEEEIDWNFNKGYFEKNYSNDKVKLKDIKLNDWCIVKDFEIYQKTKINNSETIESKWDLNVDGTFTMDCKFSSPKGIYTNEFVTAMTCTQKNFNIIKYPNCNANTSDENLEKIQKIPVGDGIIKQYNPISKLQLDTRFTKFTLSEGNGTSYLRYHIGYYYWIDNYFKFYYAPTLADRIYFIKDLSFSKSLDFRVGE